MRIISTLVGLALAAVGSEVRAGDAEDMAGGENPRRVPRAYECRVRAMRKGEADFRPLPLGRLRRRAAAPCAVPAD